MQTLDDIRLLPVTLQDGRVRLEPLIPHHADELWPHATEPGMWRYMLFDVGSVAELGAWIAARRARPSVDLPFLQRDLATGHAFGATSLFDLDAKNRNAEIGHTWIGPSYRGTGLNLHAKRLLFAHAFDTLGLVRVQLKCDAQNTRSRSAILRLGAVFEGVLRAHRLRTDGTLRDTAMYSVTRDEWPAVRARLDGLLDHPPHPEP